MKDGEKREEEVGSRQSQHINELEEGDVPPLTGNKEGKYETSTEGGGGKKKKKNLC